MTRALKFLALTAVAGTLLAPAAHADDVYAGFTCGLVAANDGTGLVQQDPNVFNGVLLEYAYVVNTTGGTIFSVTVTCAVQVNSPVFGSVPAVSRSATSPGNGSLLVDAVSFTAQPGDSVYVCTTLEWESSKGGGSVTFDADHDPSNGTQCRLATSFEGGDGDRSQRAEAEPWEREAGNA